MQEVEQALALDGLKINGDKTQCISSADQQVKLTVGGKHVDISGPDFVIEVLGANFSLEGRAPLIIACMQQTARAVLLDTLIRTAAL